MKAILILALLASLFRLLTVRQSIKYVHMHLGIYVARLHISVGRTREM